MGPMSPALMYFDPSMLKDSVEQMKVIPEVGAPSFMGMMKKVPGVGGAMDTAESAAGMAKDAASTVSAVKDAGSMAKGLTQGDLPSYDSVTGMVKKIPGAEKVGEAMDTIGNVGKIAADLA